MDLFARIKVLTDRLLPHATFTRSVSVLAGGTTAAQAIGVLALPVITRLYNPDDFSVLAVYASILGIFAGVACLRLDIAIPLPKDDEDAANLLILSLLASTAIALVAALSVWWFPDHIVHAAGQPGLAPFLWMIPFGIWLESAYSAVQLWATRKKRFTAIARTRIEQITGNTFTQLAGGVWNTFGPLGLLLGQLIGSGAGVFGLSRKAWSEDQEALRRINWLDMRRMFREYDQFPKYSTFEVLANNGAIQFPVIIIAAVALGPEAGYLFLAMRAMTIPLSLIGAAVSQVYLSHAADENRAGRLGVFTLKTISGLMRIGVGPILFAGIVSPAVFPFIFGSEWQRAGEMAVWMTPWFIMQFVSSPVSMSLHVTNNQQSALKLQIFGILLRVGAVWLAAVYAKHYVFETYAITGFIFYTVYLLIVAQKTKIQSADLFLTAIQSCRFSFVWGLVAIAIVGTFLVIH